MKNKPAIVEYLYQEKMKELKADSVKEIDIREPSVWFSTEFANDYVGESIKLDGQDWPTVEHYYQAMKLKTGPTERNVYNPYEQCLHKKYCPRVNRNI